MLEERVAKVPEQITATLALQAPTVPREASRWITAGVGSSEGPARLLASLLRHGGSWAEYAPLSAFAVDPTPRGDVCVLFSQSLSPNARLVLRARERFRDVIVVSSIASDHPLGAELVRRGALLVTHGPAEERGMLLRVLGSTAACVVASRLACAAIAERQGHEPPWSVHLSRLAQVVAQAACPAAPLHPRLVLVSAEEDPRTFEGLRLKIVEGLGRDAVVVDVCAIAHGPLQSFWDEPATIVTLESAGDRARDLFDRLASVLRPHHQLIRLVATLAAPLDYFEHAAMLDHFVLAALRARPRDLSEWPGKGHDGALYDVGQDVLDER